MRLRQGTIPTTTQQTALEGNETEQAEKYPKRKDVLVIWFAAILSILLISVVTYVSIKVIVPPVYFSVKDISVGNYIGKNIDEVEQIFEDAKIAVNIKDVNDESKAGTILLQDVEPGKTLKVGGYNKITLTVSLGMKYVLIPNLKNIDYKLAEINLKNLDITSDIEEEFSESLKVTL